MMDTASIRQAADFIRLKAKGIEPSIGIILGSGLGDLADSIENPVVIPYADIPNFPQATALGHKGDLIIGKLAGKDVIAMQGRLHYYEGIHMDSLTLPERVMSLLGVKTLIVSCATGCVNSSFRIGDIMLIRDHISLLPNPLIGPNNDDFGPRFPDMTCAYDTFYQNRLTEIATELGITLRRGTLLVCSGPCYETPAEYRYFRTIGADAIGMSTAPEVIVARHCGMRVLGIAVITDMAPDSEGANYVTDGEEIIRIAKEAASKMKRLLMRFLQNLQ